MKKPESDDDTGIRAVEMVRSIRDQMYEETKHLSPEELMAYIARAAARATQDRATGEDSSRRSADDAD
jgi:hypothetical protein